MIETEIETETETEGAKSMARLGRSPARDFLFWHWQEVFTGSSGVSGARS
jgi:hypothetical protein